MSSKKKTVFMLSIDRKSSGKLEAFGYCDSHVPQEVLEEILELATNIIKEEMDATNVEPESVSESTSQRDRDSGRETHEPEDDGLR